MIEEIKVYGIDHIINCNFSNRFANTFSQRVDKNDYLKNKTIM